MDVKRAALRALAATLAGSAAWAAPASAAVTGTEDANALASAATGSPSAGAGLQAAQNVDTGYYPAAVSDSPLGGFPTAGPSFAVLTTGDSELADDPNDNEGNGRNLDFNIDARGSANDPLILAIPINVPAPNNCLAIDYKFLSEEFPEFVNQGFNDTFLIELDQTSWVVNPDNSLNAPGDIAAAKGDRVSVDTVGPTSVDPAQSAGTTYDAATGTLTAKAAVASGAHTLYVSIFDSGDYIYDSAAFVDNVRSFVEDPSTCKPPDIFAGATGVTVPSGQTLKVKGKTVAIPITCNLQVGITVNCDGTLTLTGALPKNPRQGLRAKKKQLGKATYSVPPGESANVPIKLSGKARKALGKKGKLKATLTTTNSANGATQTSKVKLKGKKKRKK